MNKRKKMPGQISLFDYWLENFSFGARCRQEGYTNVYDAMPEREGKVKVIDRNGNRFTVRAVMSFGSMAFTGGDRGYDICWWKYCDN